MIIDSWWIIKIEQTFSFQRVTFDENVQKSGTPIQTRRAQFAQYESVQSSLREIPLETAAVMNQRTSPEDSAEDHLEASTDLNVINPATTKIPIQAPITVIQKPIAPLKPSMSSSSIQQQAQAVVETVPISTKPILGQVRAKFNYKAQNDDEISFQKGDIIKVVKKDELWWVGYVNEETIGYFPGNYVGEMEVVG